MSLGVCGCIHQSICDISFDVSFSFYFEKIANSLGIGTKMGGNISRYVYDKYTDMRRCGLFELTDSPLHDYAEELFAPYGDDLTERMNRIQALFELLLKHDHITGVTLIINYRYDECEYNLDVKASELSATITDIFVRENHIEPPTIVIDITL